MLSLSSEATVSLHRDILDIPPPSALVQDDPCTVDSARQRLDSLTRRGIFSKLSLQSSKSSMKKSMKDETATHSNVEITVSPPPQHTPIALDDSKLQDDDEKTDKYQWAVVYENQRGMTIFSIPYYSALSLLPTDPSAFTLPNAPSERSKQPPIALSTYPLPDGNWRWVSREWMIDMRNDSGIVQYDGFEYNWTFRRHKWRAQTGFFSAGGWVRRRRWVRLMMRPEKKSLGDHEGPSHSASLTSLISTLSNVSDVLHASIDVWQGGDVDEDWKRCRAVMLRCGRDGAKMELWRTWLGYYHPEYEHQFREGKGKEKQKQWTEDEGPLPSELLKTDTPPREIAAPPLREYMVAVLRKHGRELLELFVYPDSRVEFLKLVGRIGLECEIIGVDIGFWSYRKEMSTGRLIS